MKTYKREIACAALTFWGVLTWKVFWGMSPDLINATSSAYGTASTMIWLFVGAAFGYDAYVKQGGGYVEPSSRP